MSIKQFRPMTAGTRFRSVSGFDEVTRTTPEKSLLEPRRSTGGRNNQGHLTSRHRGGGHKRQYRKIDFKRNKIGVPASVVLAIWGRETDYGRYRLPYDTLRVVATQAYVGRRKDQYRGEFILALKLLGEGAVARKDFRSSWAGATRRYLARRSISRRAVGSGGLRPFRGGPCGCSTGR